MLSYPELRWWQQPGTTGYIWRIDISSKRQWMTRPIGNESEMLYLAGYALYILAMPNKACAINEKWLIMLLHSRNEDSWITLKKLCLYKTTVVLLAVCLVVIVGFSYNRHSYICTTSRNIELVIHSCLLEGLTWYNTWGENRNK